MRKVFSHEFAVDLPVDEAFPLFTPKGEEGWVPGWKPDYFAPENGETKRDMLFATGEGAERTWWTCLAFEQEAHRVRYLRLTPESRAAFVEVTCRASDEQSTLVAVCYDIQALGRSGETHVGSMTDETFAAMIGEWAELIGKMTREGARSPHN